MPQDTDIAIPHSVEIAKSQGDELSVDDWLKQRNQPAQPEAAPKAAEASKTVEAPETSPTEQERDDKGQFKVPDAVQKRIDKEVARRGAAERERDEARQKLADFEAKRAPEVKEPPKQTVEAASDLKAPVKPDPKDPQFTGDEGFLKWEEAKDKYYDALADFKAKSAVADDRKQRADAEQKSKADAEFKSRQSEWDASLESSKKAHDDYDEQLESVQADIKAGKIPGLSDNVLGMIVATDSKTELLYFLASNRAELERISKLPVHQVGYELGKIEAKLDLPEKAAVVKEKDPADKPPAPEVKPRAAIPKPPEPVSRSAAAPSGPSEEDSTEEWARKRNAQVRQRGDVY